MRAKWIALSGGLLLSSAALGCMALAYVFYGIPMLIMKGGLKGLNSIESVTATPAQLHCGEAALLDFTLHTQDDTAQVPPGTAQATHTALASLSVTAGGLLPLPPALYTPGAALPDAATVQEHLVGLGESAASDHALELALHPNGHLYVLLLAPDRTGALDVALDCGGRRTASAVRSLRLEVLP